MYEINYIKSTLKKYIDKNIKDFVIYPFGANGIIVKECLKNFFDKEPCLIIDNEYCKYHRGIIDFDSLKKVYQKGMHIILTIENEKINAEMYAQLLKFVPASNIINLKETEKQDKLANGSLYDNKGFFMDTFLPAKQRVEEKHRLEKQRVKVRIVHRYPTTWNSIKTICQAFQNDEIFDTLLIVNNDGGGVKSVKQAEEIGISYTVWDKYQAESDEPDILILSMLGRLQGNRIDGLLDCRKFARLIVAAYWGVVRYDESLELFYRLFMSDFGVFQPDYFLFDTLQYRELSQAGYFQDKIVEMGNAKYDGIYHATKQEISLEGQWKKLKGKTTILWTTSHGVEKAGRVCRTCTFDKFAKSFFDYAKEHCEMGFIFRPSTALISEMLEFRFWSQSDLRYLKMYCSDSPNIVFDDTDTYEAAYSISDAILTDAFGGMVCSALPTLKPICAAYRSREEVPWHTDLLGSLYSAYESKDMIEFFEMIRKGSDPMLKIREKAVTKCVKHFDGKNGYRIKEFVKSKYFESVNLDE